eukprot:GHVP01001719.1.p1 GENE.GHVP01001719.1~~GHVP01001719.1.p1  ORF type:complete len:131 (+),score=26.63 GHVP01001719.1:150-542(+)
MQINIWDVGGQKTIRPYWRNYFEKTDGVYLVVDSSDIFRLDECRKSMHSVLKEERLTGAPVVVVANKQDLSNAYGPGEVENLLDLKLLKNRNVRLVAASAKEGTGVTDAMEWLLEEIKCRKSGAAMPPVF